MLLATLCGQRQKNQHDDPSRRRRSRHCRGVRRQRDFGPDRQIRLRHLEVHSRNQTHRPARPSTYLRPLHLRIRHPLPLRSALKTALQRPSIRRFRFPTRRGQQSASWRAARRGSTSTVLAELRCIRKCYRTRAGVRVLVVRRRRQKHSTRTVRGEADQTPRDLGVRDGRLPIAQSGSDIRQRRIAFVGSGVRQAQDYAGDRAVGSFGKDGSRLLGLVYVNHRIMPGIVR